MQFTQTTSSASAGAAGGGAKLGMAGVTVTTASELLPLEAPIGLIELIFCGRAGDCAGVSGAGVGGLLLNGEAETVGAGWAGAATVNAASRVRIKPASSSRSGLLSTSIW